MERRSMTNQIISQIAESQIGVLEWGEGSNPAVVKYYEESGHAEVQDDATPWCAAFVGSVLSRAGVQPTGSLLARSYEKWGTKVASLDKAQKGDVIVISRGTKSWQGHVGFYAGHDANNIHMLGGNQGDSVCVANYARSRLVAIRRAPQPKTKMVQSKTLGASQVAKLAATATPIVGAVGGMPWQNLAIVGGLSVIVLIATGVIDIERIKKWKAGVK
jgi:uncharacterized protein (TIGR02594 family)